MKQRRPQADPRDTGSFRTERIDVSAQGDRQSTMLVAQNTLYLPALRDAYSAIAPASARGSRDRMIAVTGVFHAAPPLAQRQRVHEAVVALLGHGCIHDDRTIEVVVARQLQHLPGEFLKTERQVRRLLRTTPIDHTAPRSVLLHREVDTEDGVTSTASTPSLTRLSSTSVITA